MKHRVVVEQWDKSQGELNKEKLLERALDRSGFWEILEKERARSGKIRANFVILIKPNLGMFFGDTLTITDPELVEHFIDLLHDRGFTRVWLGEAQNSFFKWLHNREIHHLAQTAGYKGTTSQGNVYEIKNLSQDSQDYPFPDTDMLYGAQISRSWLDADFRVSFPKYKTHEEYGYTLSLKNLLGVLPEADKHFHYHSRLKVWEVVYEVFRAIPVHFGIIDAVVSSHGNVGAQVGNPLHTHTVFAGDHLLLLDWVGALKMGTDPYSSPLNARALHALGLPEEYEIIGSLKPYPGWKNVHPLLMNALFKLDEAAALARFFWPSTFRVDTSLFPWKKQRYHLVNLLFSKAWAGVDRSRILFLIALCIHYIYLFGFNVIRMFRTLIRKDRLRRRIVNLYVDPQQFTPQTFDSLPRSMRPLIELMDCRRRKEPKGAHAFVDGGMVFALSRSVPIPFDDFVSKVPIDEAIIMMKDYIGGRTHVVKRNAQGKPEHQVERTLFLPQPNLFIIFWLKDIDVSKVEHITYQSDLQQLLWKTVHSVNQTALIDDGVVRFIKEQNGEATRLELLVHQHFLNPPELHWLQLSLYPRLRRMIMLSIYRHFFKITLDNYVKRFHGEFKPIGHKWLKEEVF